MKYLYSHLLTPSEKDHKEESFDASVIDHSQVHDHCLINQNDKISLQNQDRLAHNDEHYMTFCLMYK